MKIVLTTFMLLSLCSCLQAQGRYLRMINDQTGQVKIFNENHRLKIKTLDRKKYIGRLTIINKDIIAIKGNEIALSDIYRIRNRSVLGAVKNTFITIIGNYVVLISPVGVMHGGGIGGVLSIFATGSVISLIGIFSHELTPVHQNDQWQYEIILN